MSHVPCPLFLIVHYSVHESERGTGQDQDKPGQGHEHEHEHERENDIDGKREKGKKGKREKGRKNPPIILVMYRIIKRNPHYSLSVIRHPLFSVPIHYSNEPISR